MRNPFVTAIEALLAVAAAVLMVWLAYDNARMSALLAQARGQHASLLAEVASQRAAFEARARQREREQHAALAAVRHILNEDLVDAQAKHDAVVADLAADNLRLRRHWQGCIATADLSATVVAAARVDAGAELRARGAADLVRLGAQCDARIRAWQTLYASQRGEP